MQKKLAIIIALVMVATLSVAGCTVNTSSQNPSPSTQAQVTKTESEATVTPDASATPTPSTESMIASNLKAHSARLVENEGYSIVTAYYKTTLNGREVYIGKFQKNGVPSEHNVYPMSSYAEAVSFKEQLINKFKEQGYTRYTSSTADMWIGYLGNTVVSLGALKDSENGSGANVVWVTKHPIVE